MITHKSIGYSGRLGNQMFQYAALKAVALEKGFDYYLPNHLNIKHDGAYDFTNNQWLKYKLDLLDGFDLKCPILENTTDKLYHDSEFVFNSKLFDIEDNTAIDGYFQSPKYFDKHKDEIIKDFTFKSDILNKCEQIISQHSNPVSIHVRRGDYVKHPGFWVVTPEYIQEALSHFTDNNYTFLIFSDDINWCKEVFPEGVVFIENNNQFEDLCLMSLCEHNIIANSSYSWWGAYLNKNKDKRVVAPSNWFTDSKPLIDLYPNNWIII